MEEEQNWVAVPIRTLVHYLSDSGISYEKIAKLWNISKLQVHYYSNGTTKKPSIKVAKAIYDSTLFNGKKAVLADYADEAHLLTTFLMYEKGQ